MCVLSFVLDAFVLHTHALMRALSKSGDSIIDAATIKRRKIIILIPKHVMYRKQSVEL